MLVLKGYIWKVGVWTENSSLQRQAPGKQPAQPLALCLSFRLISVMSLAVLPFLQPFPSHSNHCNHLIVTHLKAGDSQQAVTLITERYQVTDIMPSPECGRVQRFSSSLNISPSFLYAL